MVKDEHEEWTNALIEDLLGDEWQEHHQALSEQQPEEEVEDPIHDFDTLQDVVYFAARRKKGLSLKPEHEKILDEKEPKMIAQSKQAGFAGSHEQQVDTHINVRDDDTDERDEKWYSNDRLHSEDGTENKFWQDILVDEEYKMAWPNHMTNRGGRGGRRIIHGSGPEGLFRYNELDKIEDNRIYDEVHDAWDKEYKRRIKRQIIVTIKDARQRIKEENPKNTLTRDKADYIKRKVETELGPKIKEQSDKDMQHNVYGFGYGPQQSSGFGGSVGGGKKYFAGRFKGIGYDPTNPKEIKEGITAVRVANFGTWPGLDKRKGKYVPARNKVLNFIKAHPNKFTNSSMESNETLDDRAKAELSKLVDNMKLQFKSMGRESQYSNDKRQHEYINKYLESQGLTNDLIKQKLINTSSWFRVLKIR